ncbi:MAG TPA: sugar phosphate isomerase/epimerase [Bryobacteraceae bacterium]|nr:sugar phosphate isomerase/epimerase [Bryobacteraceae bacterium]
MHTRRSFFGAGAALCAASAVRIEADAPADSFKLGVASISFLRFPRERAIAMTTALGTRYINIKFVHLALDSTPEQIRAARAEFEAAGLTILGGGLIPFDKEDDADIRHKFEYAKLAGMPLIVAGPTHRTLPMLEKFVREYDIRVAVHNHGPEDKQFPTPQSVLAEIKGMDPRIGLCVDVGHTLRAGADPVASLADAGRRLLDIHMKDLRNPGAWQACPVGDGVMPVPALFRQLRKMHYTGAVNLEYETDEDNPFPGMQKSFAYMRGALAGLGA